MGMGMEGQRAVEQFRLAPLTEADVRAVIESAGGHVAHPDHDRRRARGADFVLGNALLELKTLDDEGLGKPERQAKLGALFERVRPGRPVVVVDRSCLEHSDRREFDRVMEGPIKAAVASARKQLKQSRREIADVDCSILMILNNGYSALNHRDLSQLVAHRVRQDTSEIDGVVVAGCYFHSDTFDTVCLWHMDYIPIDVRRRFERYNDLHLAWQGLANASMTRMITKAPGKQESKLPVRDITFEVNGVRFVKPTPQMGKASDFFVMGRPRHDSSGLTQLPPVATTFPDLTLGEWTRFRTEVPDETWQQRTWEDWLRYRARAKVEAGLQPVALMPVTFDGWSKWYDEAQEARLERTVANYANHLFVEKLRSVGARALNRSSLRVCPIQYVLALTEEIGQDRANDVSHIGLVDETAEVPRIRSLIVNQRMFHEHAVIKGAAFAIALGVDTVLWEKDLRYAWT
jgi:hypothetical protein